MLQEGACSDEISASVHWDIARPACTCMRNMLTRRQLRKELSARADINIDFDVDDSVAANVTEVSG